LLRPGCHASKIGILSACPTLGGKQFDCSTAWRTAQDAKAPPSAEMRHNGVVRAPFAASDR
jgi:hypothetical protein